ncbi:MAG: hypothetical protein R3F62_25360 [Planctomycetota bacterium]
MSGAHAPDRFPSRPFYAGAGLFLVGFAALLLALYGVGAGAGVWELPPAELDPELLQDRAAAQRRAAEQRARLDEVRWVDREAGWVSLPIERAMRQIAAQEERR